MNDNERFAFEKNYLLKVQKRIEEEKNIKTKNLKRYLTSIEVDMPK